MLSPISPSPTISVTFPLNHSSSFFPLLNLIRISSFLSKSAHIVGQSSFSISPSQSKSSASNLFATFEIQKPSISPNESSYSFQSQSDGWILQFSSSNISHNISSSLSIKLPLLFNLAISC